MRSGRSLVGHRDACRCAKLRYKVPMTGKVMRGVPSARVVAVGSADAPSISGRQLIGPRPCYSMRSFQRLRAP